MARLRTFIAVDLGDAICDRCVSLQEKLAGTGADINWVDAENMHITLLFLGEVDDREIAALCNAVADCCAERDAFTLTVEGVGCFGNPLRPRTIWVGIGEGEEELVALHEALEAPLLKLGCYRREERRFTPHLTLGRVKSERAGERLAAELKRLENWPGSATEVREVLVMSSELRSRGPTYTVLSRAKLRRAPKRKREEEE